MFTYQMVTLKNIDTHIYTKESNTHDIGFIIELLINASYEEIGIYTYIYLAI